MTDVKDWLGRDIMPNDLVLYATAYGSSQVELRFGRVVTLGIDDDFSSDNQVLVLWHKSSKYSLPDSPETWVRKEKLTVMPDDFFE